MSERPPFGARATPARALLHFIVLGGIAFGVSRTIAHGRQERPPVTVHVPADATEAETRLATDEAILVEEAISLGWDDSDPIVRARLVQNVRYARGIAPDAPLTVDGVHEALEQARSLDMARRDIVVRRRLILRMEQLLSSDVRSMELDDAELSAFVAAHRERFMQPTRVRFDEIFLSRQRRGAELDRAAAELQELLADENEGTATAGEAWQTLGDPLHFGAGDRWVSLPSVAARRGAELADALEDAPMNAWSGPHRTEFGLHFVRVRERRAARLPPLEAIRSRAAAAYREAKRSELIRERMNQLRGTYRIEVIRDAPTAADASEGPAQEAAAAPALERPASVEELAE